MQVIRTGRKPVNDGRWSDAKILQCFWQMEEERGGRKNPMNAMPSDIPELHPIPQKPQERDDYREIG